MHAPAAQPTRPSTMQAPRRVRPAGKSRFAMYLRVLWITFVSLTMVSGAAQLASGQDPASDVKWVNSVLQQLLATKHATRPASHFQSWPPTVQVIDVESNAKLRELLGLYNAFAYCDSGVPRIGITRPFMRAYIEGEVDRLAFALGHELAHLALVHTPCKPLPPDTPFLRAVFDRAEEHEADVLGMKLALAAGYSHRNGLKVYQRMQELDGYSSFEALQVGHPSTTERLARLDNEQMGLWRAMSSFDNGTYFLVAEQYHLAERAFRAVTSVFPDSYEAWANLGYALLMQYADALETKDLKRFDIGQIVVGGFYRRPATLEARVRGIDEELWWSAVRALRKAEAGAGAIGAGSGGRVQPNLVFVKANLGLAHLLRPFGKDAEKAIQYFEQAETELARFKTINAFARSQILNNLAVAYCAGGKEEECSTTLAEARDAIRESVKDLEELGALEVTYLAFLYNAATLTTDSDLDENRQAVLEVLENYLTRSSPAAAWWKLAHERYKELGGKRPERQLQAATTPTFRPVLSVSFDSELTMALGQPSSDVRKHLGEAVTVPVVPRTSLKRIYYPQRGVEFLVNEEVLAIALKGQRAPRISLEPRGTATGQGRVQIYTGMTGSALERILADAGCKSGCEPVQLLDAGSLYRFYRSLGVAVRIDESGTVSELVVVQVPESRL